MIINESKIKRTKTFKTKDQSKYLDAIDKLDHSKSVVSSYETREEGSYYIIDYTVNEDIKVPLNEVIDKLERYAKIDLQYISSTRSRDKIIYTYKIYIKSNSVFKIKNIINRANKESTHYEFKFLDDNRGNYKLIIDEYSAKDSFTI